jgi:hypothetical protein
MSVGPWVPVVPEVRELINDFYASRYPACLAALAGRGTLKSAF